MIKNTSGLAVQPCRLHERFYYHARLLYYILRQKARGFFDAGAEAPSYPLFSLCLPGGVLRGRGPQHLPMQALRPAPGGDLCGAGSPSTHILGAPPQTPGDFRFTTKVTKGVPRATAPGPREGDRAKSETLFAPAPSAVPAPPRYGFYIQPRPICHFEFVGKSVFFLPELHRGSHPLLLIRGAAGLASRMLEGFIYRNQYR